MSNDKYSQGGKYAPHRFNSGNRDYNPIVKTGPSLGCITTLFAVMSIVLYFLVQSF